MPANDRPDPMSSAEVMPVQPQQKPREEPKGVWIDRGPDIPGDYGRDCIVILVRDPECIFAYWELADGAMQGLAARLGPMGMMDARWLIRVFDCTRKTSFDAGMNPSVPNWYLTVLPETTYYVQLGLMLRNHQFVPIVTSNTVTTPRRGLANEVDADWQPSPEELATIMKNIQKGAPPGYERYFGM
jgi:hypothetical protein